MDHTKGPWKIQKASNGQGLLIKPVPGQVVAEVDPGPNQQVNARLIAAAPDMYATLRGFAKIMDQLNNRLLFRAHPDHDAAFGYHYRVDADVVSIWLNVLAEIENLINSCECLGRKSSPPSPTYGLSELGKSDQALRKGTL